MWSVLNQPLTVALVCAADVCCADFQGSANVGRSERAERIRSQSSAAVKSN